MKDKQKQAKEFVKKHGFLTVRDLCVHFELNSPHDTIMWLKSEFRGLREVRVRNPREKTWFKIHFRPSKRKVVNEYIRDKGLEVIA